MSIIKITTKDAMRNFVFSNYSKWFSLKKKNTENMAYIRLDQNDLFDIFINPEFQFSPNDNIFTVGSCFARGLEKSLVMDNISVLSTSLDFDSEKAVKQNNTAMGYMNKYNTYSILYEFDWALNNKFQNGENFIQIDQDTCFDTNSNPVLPFTNFEKSLERRRKIHSVFNKIINCKVLTITLGLVEVWHDLELDLFLNATPPHQLLRRFPDRFQFEVMDFQDNMHNLEMLYEIFKAHGLDDMEIVITVSPVPLQATFSGRDVVLANTFSKSLLRIVAETWANAHNNVHYFPSYEIVMNSNQNIWENDKRHLKGYITQYIMEVFKKNYMEGYNKWQKRIPKIRTNINGT